MSSEAAFPTFAIHKSFIYMLGTYINTYFINDGLGLGWSFKLSFYD